MTTWIRRHPLMLTVTSAAVIAVVLGVIWGLAGTSDAQPNAGADGSTTTISIDATTTLPDTSTTTSLLDTTTSTPATATTRDRQNPPTTSPSVNQPPTIDDLGVSSDGLTLLIEPTISDADDTELIVTYSVNDEEVFTGSESLPHTVGFDVEKVGYTHTATVVISVDDGTETVTEVVEHELAAITSVVVEKLAYDMRVPDVCFESSAAERLSGTVVLTGVVETSNDFSLELRPDRPDVVLIDGLGAEFAGEPPPQVISITDLTLAGATIPSISRTYSESGSSIASAFRHECRGTVAFKVGMQSR